MGHRLGLVLVCGSILIGAIQVLFISDVKANGRITFTGTIFQSRNLGVRSMRSLQAIRLFEGSGCYLAHGVRIKIAE